MCMVVIVVKKSNIRLVTPNIIDAAKKEYRKCHCKMKNKCMESVIQRQQPFV